MTNEVPIPQSLEELLMLLGYAIHAENQTHRQPNDSGVPMPPLTAEQEYTVGRAWCRANLSRLRILATVAEWALDSPNPRIRIKELLAQDAMGVVDFWDDHWPLAAKPSFLAAINHSDLTVVTKFLHLLKDLLEE